MLKWGLAFLNHCTNRWIKCHHSADNAFFKHIFVHFGCIFTVFCSLLMDNISTLTIKPNVKLIPLLITIHQECVITFINALYIFIQIIRNGDDPSFCRVHASSGVKGLRHFPLLPANFIAPAGYEGRGFSMVYLLNNALNILDFMATRKVIAWITFTL